MAIHFNSLPQQAENSSTLLEPGQYKGTVIKAEMKTPSNANKPDYLNITIQIFDENEKKLGVVFDKLFDPEAYTSANLALKLCNFMKATGTTEMTQLKDIAKVCCNRPFMVQLKKAKDMNDNDCNEVNIFKNPCYEAITVNEGFLPAPEGGDEEGIPFSEATSDSNY